MAPVVIMSGSSALIADADADADAPTRLVRFDDECVLIPDPPPHSTRRPKIVTKSYSLPLWKRRVVAGAASDGEDGVGEEESEKVVLSIPLPIPTFHAARALSPTRTATSPMELTPCLVHRSPGPPSPTLARSRPPLRRPSLPLPPKPHAHALHAHLTTVPLRACCAACLAACELPANDDGHERFTRGARRRRRSSSASSDGGGVPARRKVADALPGFADLRVDEVDKRRLSASHDMSKIGPGTKPSSARDDADDDDADEEEEEEGEEGEEGQDEEGGGSKRRRRAEHSLSPVLPRVATPIAEENEDELFPLPSPRRTPTSSPLTSPNPSSTQLALALANSAKLKQLPALPAVDNASTSSLSSTASGRVAADPKSNAGRERGKGPPALLGCVSQRMLFSASPLPTPPLERCPSPPTDPIYSLNDDAAPTLLPSLARRASPPTRPRRSVSLTPASPSPSSSSSSSPAITFATPHKAHPSPLLGGVRLRRHNSSSSANAGKSPRQQQQHNGTWATFFSSAIRGVGAIGGSGYGV
ncbi:hypothetical protein PUNSTDRAFT_139803 [Punctularia strigosozonata HHB-11173 SS5]|uniref:uncharacterized protein n=1 Tax=Punctularia strigosozonata (strain HHB-11173) TaxID=741275 RepID=UPI0004417992|nr:uncharacterized protein PUNSTDRAFT_139803 [Punctularia strigosozonata HHB-11173 SS5]EIN13156.1 hypothetical protein PUNSTDRAFT_139803 [Punctularia strigosozonata HHB-11173 SS5]